MISRLPCPIQSKVGDSTAYESMTFRSSVSCVWHTNESYISNASSSVRRSTLDIEDRLFFQNAVPMRSAFWIRTHMCKEHFSNIFGNTFPQTSGHDPSQIFSWSPTSTIMHSFRKRLRNCWFSTRIRRKSSMIAWKYRVPEGLTRGLGYSRDHVDNRRLTYVRVKTKDTNFSQRSWVKPQPPPHHAKERRTYDDTSARTVYGN